MGAADDFKQAQRRTWAAGDWPTIAETIQEVSDEMVERLGIVAGQRMLDVACGSGNAAIPAALRGADVVGLDLVPELLELARERADEAGVEIHLHEGDAEALPFEDASFDRVLSVFGAMFAPRQEQAAAELLRVARPGAVVGVAAWTPEGLNGEMFKTLAAHLPPQPPELKPPVLWGDEAHVRGLLDRPGVDVSCERRTTAVEAESPEIWVAHCEEALGPFVMAKAVLEPEGAWEAARADLLALYERRNEADDGTLYAPAEYLVTVASIAT